MYQRTIKKPISISGYGLHTGKKINLLFHPAPINTGIIFNYKNSQKIPLNISSVVQTTRSISIGKKKCNIMTIEHLSAALYMLGITNLFININNNEIPALDGSSKAFTKLFYKSGIYLQKKPIHLSFLKKNISVYDGEKFIIGLPSHKLKITYNINFPHPKLRHKTIFFNNINENVFKKEIGPARTFGFLNEVNDLLKKKLGLGGTLKNTVILTETGYVNNKLRFKDECIRHKVLDFIGALALVNRPVHAHFIIYKSGHKLDVKFMKKLIKSI